MARRSEFGLSVDDDMIRRWKEETEREAHEQKLRDWCQEQMANCVYINEAEKNPCNYFQQLGNPMMPEQLEAKLKKVRLKSGSLLFEYDPRPSFWHKKHLYWLKGAAKIHVSAYENGIMPERSVIRTKTEDVRDMSVRNVSNRDMPKGEYVPGEGYVYDKSQPLPGWKRVEIPIGEGAEGTRGWRTVLLYLVAMDIATPAAVESIFGADNTPNWAYHTGKRKDVSVPW